MRAWLWIALSLLLATAGSALAGPPVSVLQNPTASDVGFDAGGALEVRWETTLGADFQVEIRRRNATDDVSVLGRFPADQHKVIDRDVATDVGYTYELHLYDVEGHLVSNVRTGEPAYARGNWLDLGKLGELILIALLFAVILWGTFRAGEIYVRPIAGLAAMEEAIGRAVEMGKPVLFSAGWGAQLDKPTTMAAMNIFGWLARKSAEYSAQLKFPAHDAVIMAAAQEAAHDSALLAGKPEWYVPEDIYYVTGSQFGYAAALDGIMERERPAANLWLGTFAAESLILAETGNHIGAVQIAGTDSTIQLAFFLVTCDHTLIGEEVFAASGYLTRDPMVLGGLRAQDLLKVVVGLVVLTGLVGAALDWNVIGDWLRNL